MPLCSNASYDDRATVGSLIVGRAFTRAISRKAPLISCVFLVRTGSETKYGRVTWRTPLNNYFVLCHSEICSAGGKVGTNCEQRCEASHQGELDDAKENEDKKSSGDGHVHRVAHDSPGTSVAVL